VFSPDVIAFVRAALGEAPLRVLEVGAGGGVLAAAMRDGGHDVVAIDPASEADGVEAVALLDLDAPPGSFDAAVGVVSLHHLEPLEASLERLARLVRPGGTLVVDEIDVDRLDERAAAWWIGQQRALGGEHGHDEPAGLVAEMRHHIHPLSAIRDGLGGWFALGEPVRGPYLHRWSLPLSLREAEVEQLAAGALPAVGARLVGIRRG
jgi:SAM-dependent methyltransferase